MSSPTNPTSSGNPSSGDGGDPWEQLAEDLFGLEYGKEHGSRESSSPAIEPVAPVGALPQNVRDEEHREPVSVTSPAEPGPEHRLEEPSFAAEPASDEPDASPEPESVDEQGVPSQPATAEAASPQDSYWDALANWNWDESDGAGSKAKSEAPRSSGGPPPRGGARGRDDRRDRRGGERPQRQATETSPPESSRAPSSPPGASPAASTRSASTAHPSTTQPVAPHAPRPAAPVAGDDFGLGVADAPAVRSDHRPAAGEGGAVPSPQTGNSPHKKEEGEFPRKRRRRRRRRSRGGDREAGPLAGGAAGDATAPASLAPGDEWDDSAGPESDVEADEPQTPVVDARDETKDEIEGDRHVPARGPRRGPRNERTRHEGSGRRSTAGSSEGRAYDGPGDGPAEFEEEPLLVGGGVDESSSDDDGEDDAGEQAVSYENVPTWEEAISYLLHPNQVQVEPGAGNGSVPPRGAPQADQPRQTRHMGSQKHRR
jgi:hypothetical protein